MSTATFPASIDEALDVLRSALGFLADVDASELPAETVAACVRGLEDADAIGAAARGNLLASFDARDLHLCDGQRTTRAWLVNTTGITRRQAAEHLAVAGLAREHPRMLAGLRGGQALTKSLALQAIKWMIPIPDQFQDEAEEIVVTAVLAGADLSAVAAIIAEIKRRTAPDQDRDPDAGYGVSLDTTIDGAGVLRGDLSPKCAAMVRSVLDALSAPKGADDLRTKDERYHDALSEAMKRLLASDLLPKRAGQPVKALVHIYFAELREMDGDSALQDKWITEYRAAWAAHRAAASVRPGDGGAWLEGDEARAVACDAMRPATRPPAPSHAAPRSSQTARQPQLRRIRPGRGRLRRCWPCWSTRSSAKPSASYCTRSRLLNWDDS